MAKYFLIAWPDKRAVREDVVRGWATDAIANKEIDGPEDLDTEALCKQLDSAGLITWYGCTIEGEPQPGRVVDATCDPDLPKASSVKIDDDDEDRDDIVEELDDLDSKTASEWWDDLAASEHDGENNLGAEFWDDDPDPYAGTYSEE